MYLSATDKWISQILCPCLVTVFFVDHIKAVLENNDKWPDACYVGTHYRLLARKFVHLQCTCEKPQPLVK